MEKVKFLIRIFMSDFGKVLVYLLLKFMKGSAVYILACMILLNLTATRTSAREGEQISPLYFGPNALPVPDMLDGRVSERFYLELDYDCHSGFYGDLTQTVFAKANIPLFSPRVNLSLWMPVVEFYRNTPASIEHSRPPEVSYRGWQIGNVYVSVDIQVLKERRFLPDMTVRAAIVTASGDGDEYLRNYDAPGYFFDASIGKSVKFQDGFFQSLRLAVNAGFLCWQVSANTQNDAYMYGVKTVLETRLLDVSCAWQGYTGWIGDGDAPMVIKATAVFHAGRFRPLIAYEYGLRDYPFHHFRVGVGFVFGQAEALIRIRER